MARPKKEIDQKQFESLCAIQCTKLEICSVFDVTDKTLEQWCKRTYQAGFSEVFRQKREAGKASLRRTQFQQATKSPAMAIFLGKNYLGQKDKDMPDINVTTVPITTIPDSQIKEMIAEFSKYYTDSEKT
ncbi:hypothetical protein [Immundisolibacter sp.]